MRWEKASGLPVHRVPGGRGRSVFAFKGEVAEWLAGHGDVAFPNAPTAAGELPPTPVTTAARRSARPWRVAVTVAGGVVVLFVAGRMLADAWSIPTVASIHASHGGLEALDARGESLWRYEVPQLVDMSITEQTAVVADINGDGRADALVAATVSMPSGVQDGWLLAIDGARRVLWQRALAEHYRFGDIDYGPPWPPVHLASYRVGGQPRVAVAAHHYTWWPAIVAVLDADGRTVGRFVNAGWIHDVIPNGDGRYLLASGVSNTHGGGILAVLDAAHPDGASPPGGTLAPCSDCPAGSPVAYVLAPWSDVAAPTQTPSTTVRVFPSGEIELRFNQRVVLHDETMPEVIVNLAPDLTVTRRTVSDSFWEWHARLEGTGVLKHAAAQCPWRIPPVRVWTPALGWRDVK
jgi:hypothetical protein